MLGGILNFAFLASTLACTFGSTVSRNDEAVPSRWCCKSADELNKCQVFAAKGNDVFPFQCVSCESTLGCIEKLAAQECDVIALDGGDIYAHQNQLSIVAAEDNGAGEGTSYYAVAVVKKSSMPALNLNNIAGFTTCHTGVGKTAGWNMPMGWFIRHGVNASQIRASCAPGSYDNKYMTAMQQMELGCPDKWCALCKGDGNGSNVCERDNDELYYGYSGALNCLKEVGNVAFVKHSTVAEEEHGDFELLCPDGLRAPMPDYKRCNLGSVPSHAVVMHATSRVAQRQRVLTALVNAKKSIGGFNTFGGKDLLWSSSTENFLDRINTSVQNYLGQDYICNLDAMETGGSSGACKVF